jgi:hypothetical protein
MSFKNLLYIYFINEQNWWQNVHVNACDFTWNLRQAFCVKHEVPLFQETMSPIAVSTHGATMFQFLLNTIYRRFFLTNTSLCGDLTIAQIELS